MFFKHILKLLLLKKVDLQYETAIDMLLFYIEEYEKEHKETAKDDPLKKVIRNDLFRQAKIIKEYRND